MTTLVLGASGATGQLVVKQLLAKNESVRVIVRSISYMREIFPLEVMQSGQLKVIEASVSDLSNDEFAGHLKGCRAVISCLGHNLTFKGMFGHPRRLVTDTVKNLCKAINEISKGDSPIKFILMNTTGNQNKVAGEQVSKRQSAIVKLIRILIPPHADNEDAARYLQQSIGDIQNNIAWTVVRPDSLTNEQSVTNYDIHESPIRSAIFDAGKTSRINVAHFMSELVVNETTWHTWENKMPVLYNTTA